MVFDRKQLAKDVMATISRLTDGKEFLGHEGHKGIRITRHHLINESAAGEDLVTHQIHRRIHSIDAGHSF